MKRAILAGTGTVAGLVSVLSYSPSSAQLITTAADSSAGMGGPAAAAGTDPSVAVPAANGTSATPAASPSATPKPARRAPRAKHAAATTVPTVSASPSASASTPRHPASASVVPAPKPKPTLRPAPKPTPKPTPTVVAPTGPKDYTGTAVAYKYGSIQVAIRVQAGKIVDAWAVSYPQGESLPYSQMAMPILRSQTLAAKSAKIAGASGATLTSQSWIKSLQSALGKAGL